MQTPPAKRWYCPAALGWLEQHEQQLTLKLYRYLLAGRLQSKSGEEQ
ncbi:MAG: hypothetical protein OXE49_19375 [Gemmatimonadetes bacterium]|nr:hypothetical protein [Gemmatimonadota bacterium]